jgi:type I restriction enzyme, S subunit
VFILILPGFKSSTTWRTQLLESLVKVIFERLIISGTESKRFEEIAQISSGGTPSRNVQDFYSGNIPWVKISDLTSAGKWINSTEESITQSGLESSSAKLFQKGTVLFSIYGSIGKISIADCPLTTNQAILGLTPLKDTQSEFLYYALMYSRIKLFKDAKGTSQKNISGHMVKNFYIPFPDVYVRRTVIDFLSLIEKNESYEKNELPIFLSDLPELVASIEKLAEKIERVLNLDTEDDYNDLLNSCFRRSNVEAEIKKMSDVAPLVRRQIKPKPDMSFIEIGIKSFGKGTFQKVSRLGAELGTKRVFLINKNDLIFSNVFAWEGAIAVAKTNDDGTIGSHRFITCVPKEGIAESEFLCFYFLTREGLEKIREASPGGAGRNRTLGIEKLNKINVPLPPHSDQIWFCKIKNKLDEARKLQKEKNEELDLLMMSIIKNAF